MDRPLAALLSRLGHSPRLSHPQGNAETRIKGLYRFRYVRPYDPPSSSPSPPLCSSLFAQLTILVTDMVRLFLFFSPLS